LSIVSLMPSRTRAETFVPSIMSADIGRSFRSGLY
jgi:hypothetical protein